MAQQGNNLADNIIELLQSNAVIMTDLTKTITKLMEVVKKDMDNKEIKQLVTSLESISFNAHSVFVQTEAIINDKGLQAHVDPAILKQIYQDAEAYKDIELEISLYTKSMKQLLNEKQPSMFGNIIYTA